MADDLQSLLDTLAPLLVDGSPHAVALGFHLERIEPGVAEMRAPYRDDLIGDPDTRVLHGGVVTALLDHACGLAAFAGLGGKDATATLDLRLDYMRPAEPGRDVVAIARCVRASGLFAFVSAIAHDGDENDPVATAAAAFMVTRVSQQAAEKAKRAFGKSATPISKVEEE